MSKKLLLSFFDLNAQVIYINLEGITHDESLTEPDAGGNGINWILGHVVANRNGALRTVGEKSIWTHEQTQLYKRGAGPLAGAEEAFALEKILEDFTASQQRLVEALERMDEETLTTARGESGKSPADNLTLLAFHEAYHAGQLGLLRRMVGKEGGIR